MNIRTRKIKINKSKISQVIKSNFKGSWRIKVISHLCLGGITMDKNAKISIFIKCKSKSPPPNEFCVSFLFPKESFLN
jgi:hypothetical protein